METNFEGMELCCRINVQSGKPFPEFVAVVARCAGGSDHLNAVRSRMLDISVFENDDFDPENSQAGKDRWLHFRYTLEVDPLVDVSTADYIAAVGGLLQSLWSSRMDAVASCDFEDHLPRNEQQSQWARGSIPA